MFRALPRSSSGGPLHNCIYAVSGIVTVCRWLSVLCTNHQGSIIVTQQCSVISHMIGVLSTTTTRTSSFLVSDLLHNWNNWGVLLEVAHAAEFLMIYQTSWCSAMFLNLSAVMVHMVWYSLCSTLRMEQETKIYGKSVQHLKYRQFLSCVRFPFLKRYVTCYLRRRNWLHPTHVLHLIGYTCIRLYIVSAHVKILFLSIFYVQHTK